MELLSKTDVFLGYQKLLRYQKLGNFLGHLAVISSFCIAIFIQNFLDLFQFDMSILLGIDQ